jgi:cation diffusion facilitator CzcD-associated flavoprotein CzcO
MSEHQAVVIGAGPAGLAAGAELGRAGVPTLILDQADSIGSSWRGRYDRLRLNTSRWTSKLPKARYARGTPLFPSRDEIVKYLEDYASRNELEVRLGTRVERIDRDDGGWVVRTSAGDMHAAQVIVSTGYEHTPSIPDWPGRERFPGELLHAADYRNAEPFRDKEALVVGPGCSGVEIAYDLAQGGAAHVLLAVRTPPNILLRSAGGLPNDLPARVMLKLPPRVADAQIRVIRRLAIGDLSEYGLPQPKEGPMMRLKREGKAPAIVDKEMLDAIKDGRIEIVPGVESLDETGVNLGGGRRVEPDAVIAATGYRCGLEPLVGHLGVLDERGVPRTVHGEEALPGLRFIGYLPRPGQIALMGRQARGVARQIAREMSASAQRGTTVAA